MVYTLSQFKAVLNGLGYNLGPDGHGGNYGNLLDSYTQAAIYEFQVEHRLPNTGALDAATIEKARQLVRNLQHSLNLVVSTHLPVNEFYGTNTTRAVMTFQKLYDLPITGIAGYAVRKCLEHVVKQQLRQQLNSCRLSVSVPAQGQEAYPRQTATKTP